MILGRLAIVGSSRGCRLPTARVLLAFGKLGKSPERGRLRARAPVATSLGRAAMLGRSPRRGRLRVRGQLAMSLGRAPMVGTSLGRGWLKARAQLAMILGRLAILGKSPQPGVLSERVQLPLILGTVAILGESPDPSLLTASAQLTIAWQRRSQTKGRVQRKGGSQTRRRAQLMIVGSIGTPEGRIEQQQTARWHPEEIQLRKEVEGRLVSTASGGCKL